MAIEQPLIRMSRKLDFNRQTLKVLQRQGGCGWNKQPSTGNLVFIPCAEKTPDHAEENELKELFSPPSSSSSSLPSLVGGLHSIDSVYNRLIFVDPTKGL
jgi:hypothetical protein